MSEARVVDIRAAKRRATGGLRVTPAGDVEIRLPGAPVYVLKADVAEEHLLTLLRRVRRAKWKKLGLDVDKLPPARPARRSRPEWSACHRQRDGGLGPFHGCRRRRGHEGQCRDANGDYTPAVCTHQGRGRTTVTILKPGGDETHLHCMHCNAEVTR